MKKEKANKSVTELQELEVPNYLYLCDKYNCKNCKWIDECKEVKGDTVGTMYDCYKRSKILNGLFVFPEILLGIYIVLYVVEHPAIKTLVSMIWLMVIIPILAYEVINPIIICVIGSALEVGRIHRYEWKVKKLKKKTMK